MPSRTSHGPGAPPSRWKSFVAIGDSFSEGMEDRRPDGSLRGWADLVAETLAGDGDDFRYANLAIRGRKIRQILDEQVPVAEGMRPDLVSMSGGTNDLLRPRVDLDAVNAAFEESVVRLRATGADVLIFLVGAVPALPLLSAVDGRTRPAREAVERVGRENGCIMVPLAGEPVFDHPDIWAPDRLHLSAVGHAVVAGAALEALGLGDGAWREPLPKHGGFGLLERVARDARWGTVHLAPWIGRRVTGRSSGDGRRPKRPELAPLTEG